MYVALTLIVCGLAHLFQRVMDLLMLLCDVTMQIQREWICWWIII